MHWLKDEWTYYALKRHVKSLARRDSCLISSPPDKRQHGGDTGRGLEAEAVRGRGWWRGKGRAGGARCEEGVEGSWRWRQCSYNKTGRGATFRVEGRDRRNCEGWEKKWGTFVGHLIFFLHRCIASPFFFVQHLHFHRFPPPSNIPSPISLFLNIISSPCLPPHSLPLSSVSLWREVMRETMQTQTLWIENGKRTAVGDDSDGC